MSWPRPFLVFVSSRLPCFFVLRLFVFWPHLSSLRSFISLSHEPAMHFFISFFSFYYFPSEFCSLVSLFFTRMCIYQLHTPQVPCFAISCFYSTQNAFCPYRSLVFFFWLVDRHVVRGGTRATRHGPFAPCGMQVLGPPASFFCVCWCVVRNRKKKKEGRLFQDRLRVQVSVRTALHRLVVIGLSTS